MEHGGREMRGPLLFLLSIAGAIGLAVLVVLPVRREREELAERIREADGGDAGRGEAAGVEAARRLSRALGLPRSGEPAAVRLRALVAEFAPDTDPPGASQVLEISLSWDRVPEVVEWLAVEPGPAPEDLSVTATEDPETSRVKVRFSPAPPGVTHR
jgi:hypothetical protein